MLAVLTAAYEVMQIPITVEGFTFSYWDVFIWGLLAIAVGAAIMRFFE